MSFFIHFSGDETGVCLFVVYMVGAYHTLLGIYAFPFTFVLTFTIMGLVWLYAIHIDDNSIIVLYLYSFLFSKSYILNSSYKIYAKHNAKHYATLLIFYLKEKKKKVVLFINRRSII